MPCLLVILALMAPRVVILLLWLFSSWFTGVFDTILWPILGFLFLPTTLLWFTAVHHWFGGTWSLWPVLGLVVALLIDLSPAGGRRRTRVRRDR
jgi:hypothetical protein